MTDNKDIFLTLCKVYPFVNYCLKDLINFNKRNTLNQPNSHKPKMINKLIGTKMFSKACQQITIKLPILQQGKQILAGKIKRKKKREKF